ncbi:MAG TPA: hypothetical protein VN969_15245 [Streptosporangiaceae bacterium]|jgi:hypothetical protein|nr:hypothetical protein [Streptosporangiaceae bacterium]
MDRATAAAVVAAAARRRRERKRRRRAWLMSVFTVLTLVALTVITRMVLVLDRMPATTQLSAATSSSPAAAVRVVDSVTGLSYDLLGSPWTSGCPAALPLHGVRWTGGEGTVAGIMAGGHALYGNACSGALPRAFWGAGLSGAATRVMDSVSSGEQVRGVVSSKATRIGGKPAWMLLYTVRYPGQHLAWTSSLSAVVVVGRSLFYVDVPSNLGTGNALTVLSSLR